jgi:hypothetical protein
MGVMGRPMEKKRFAAAKEAETVHEAKTLMAKVHQEEEKRDERRRPATKAVKPNSPKSVRNDPDQLVEPDGTPAITRAPR